MNGLIKKNIDLLKMEDWIENGGFDCNDKKILPQVEQLEYVAHFYPHTQTLNSEY